MAMAKPKSTLEDDPILLVPISAIADAENPVPEPSSRVASEPPYTVFGSGEKVMLVALGSAAAFLSPFTANIYVSEFYTPSLLFLVHPRILFHGSMDSILHLCIIADIWEVPRSQQSLTRPPRLLQPQSNNHDIPPIPRSISNIHRIILRRSWTTSSIPDMLHPLPRSKHWPRTPTQLRRIDAPPLYPKLRE